MTDSDTIEDDSAEAQARMLGIGTPQRKDTSSKHISMFSILDAMDSD